MARKKARHLSKSGAPARKVSDPTKDQDDAMDSFEIAEQMLRENAEHAFVHEISSLSFSDIERLHQQLNYEASRKKPD